MGRLDQHGLGSFPIHGIGGSAVLKPGKYTFEVRAFNAAGADPTPAKKSFTIT